MYDFHYNTILATYGDRAKLLFTETDSLCYDIQTDDLNKYLHEKLDTSNYNETHPNYSNMYKKVLGYMKDETTGTPLSEFVGVRSTFYAIKLKGNELKKAKDMKKSVVQKSITFEDNKIVIFDKIK